MATFSRRATLAWTGDVLRGTGTVALDSGAFAVGATFPTLLLASRWLPLAGARCCS